MQRGNLFIRYGNGRVRPVRDQEEARRLRAESTDPDMFVFQDPARDDDGRTLHGSFSRRWLHDPELAQRPASLERGPAQPGHGRGSRRTERTTPRPRQSTDGNRDTNRPATLAGPVMGHGAARLDHGSGNTVRLLDKGLDPRIPVRTTASDGPVTRSKGRNNPDATGLNMPPAPARNAARDARVLQAKARKAEAAAALRNAGTDAREMERKAERALTPSVAARIARGLAETARKAPGGVAEALEKTPAAVAEALRDTTEALGSEEMRKGVEFGARATLEVMKETGKMVGSDVVTNIVTSRLPIPASKAVSLLKAGSDAAGMKSMAQNLAKTITEIHDDVYR